MSQPTGAYRVRTLVAADRDPLLDMITGCSRDSLYQRFMTVSESAPRDYVDTVLSDPDCYTAVVECRVASAWQIVAEGSLFFRGRQPAEIALLVRDGSRCAGVGAMLTRHLCAHAARRGVSRIEATALVANHTVVRLFRRVVGAVEITGPDTGVVAIAMRSDTAAWFRTGGCGTAHPQALAPAA
jgi:hypothetical protein